MGYATINMIGPRSEPQKQERPKKDTMEQILEGLQIAQGITGIAVNYQTIKDKMSDREITQQNHSDYQAGIMSQKDKATHLAEFDSVPAGTQGSQLMKYRKGDQVEEVSWLPRKKEAGIRTPVAITEWKNGKEYKTYRDPSTVIGQSFEQKPTVQTSTGSAQLTSYKDKDGNPLAYNQKTKTFEPVKIPEGATNGTTSGGKPLGADSIQKISDLNAAQTMLGKLAESYAGKATGTLSGILQAFPSTDAKQYNNERYQAAQNIGSALEGGKLTDVDFEKYYDGMLPTPGDSNETARKKIESLYSQIEVKKHALLKSLESGGYNTGDLSSKGIDLNPDVLNKISGNAVASEKPNLNAKDVEAVNWAKKTLEKDPSNQTAIEILKINGVK